MSLSRLPGAATGAPTPSSRLLSALALALARAIVPASARAQATATPQEVPTFGATTELVYGRFHIEKKGEYVGAVRPDQLKVFEDGKEQPIALLETPQTRQRTVPPEVTLALDVSSSSAIWIRNPMKLTIGPWATAVAVGTPSFWRNRTDMATRPTVDGTTSPTKLLADCNRQVGPNGTGWVTAPLSPR